MDVIITKALLIISCVFSVYFALLFVTSIIFSFKYEGSLDQQLDYFKGVEKSWYIKGSFIKMVVFGAIVIAILF